MRRYGIILLTLAALGAAALLSQTLTNDNQLAASPGGPWLRAIVGGVSRIVGLDSTLRVTGTPPVLGIDPAAIPAAAPLRMKRDTLTFTSGTVSLTATPAPGTEVLIFCGPQVHQPGVDYTLTGTTLAPTVASLPQWQSQGKVVAVYFF